MKKSTLIVFVIMLFTSVSFAQTQVKIAIGVNSSRLSTDDANLKNDARIGWQMGGSWLLGDKLFFEPGIYFNTISSSLQSIDSVSLNYTSEIDMFRVPVFIGYHIIGDATESFFNLRVFGGPTASFITKVTETDTFSKDDFSKVLWGLDAGIGINVWWVFVDAGYGWGLNDVFSHDSYGSAKAKAFWINTGVRINM